MSNKLHNRVKNRNEFISNNAFRLANVAVQLLCSVIPRDIVPQESENLHLNLPTQRTMMHAHAHILF